MVQLSPSFLLLLGSVSTAFVKTAAIPLRTLPSDKLLGRDATASALYQDSTVSAAKVARQAVSFPVVNQVDARSAAPSPSPSSPSSSDQAQQFASSPSDDSVDPVDPNADMNWTLAPGESASTSKSTPSAPSNQSSSTIQGQGDNTEQDSQSDMSADQGSNSDDSSSSSNNNNNNNNNNNKSSQMNPGQNFAPRPAVQGATDADEVSSPAWRAVPCNGQMFQGAGQASDANQYLQKASTDPSAAVTTSQTASSQSGWRLNKDDGLSAPTDSSSSSDGSSSQDSGLERRSIYHTHHRDSKDSPTGSKASKKGKKGRKAKTSGKKSKNSKGSKKSKKSKKSKGKKASNAGAQARSSAAVEGGVTMSPSPRPPAAYAAGIASTKGRRGLVREEARDGGSYYPHGLKVSGDGLDIQLLGGDGISIARSHADGIGRLVQLKTRARDHDHDHEHEHDHVHAHTHQHAHHKRSFEPGTSGVIGVLQPLAGKLFESGLAQQVATLLLTPISESPLSPSPSGSSFVGQASDSDLGSSSPSAAPTSFLLSPSTSQPGTRLILVDAPASGTNENGMTSPSSSNGTETSGSQKKVQLQTTVWNAAGANQLLCATVDVKPPSVLRMEPCQVVSNSSSTASMAASTPLISADISQTFLFDPATGQIQPFISADFSMAQNQTLANVTSPASPTANVTANSSDATLSPSGAPAPSGDVSPGPASLPSSAARRQALEDDNSAPSTVLGSGNGTEAADSSNTITPDPSSVKLVFIADTPMEAETLSPSAPAVAMNSSPSSYDEGDEDSFEGASSNESPDDGGMMAGADSVTTPTASSTLPMPSSGGIKAAASVPTDSAAPPSLPDSIPIPEAVTSTTLTPNPSASSVPASSQDVTATSTTDSAATDSSVAGDGDDDGASADAPPPAPASDYAQASSPSTTGVDASSAAAGLSENANDSTSSTVTPSNTQGQGNEGTSPSSEASVASAVASSTSDLADGLSPNTASGDAGAASGSGTGSDATVPSETQASVSGESSTDTSGDAGDQGLLGDDGDASATATQQFERRGRWLGVRASRDRF